MFSRGDKSSSKEVSPAPRDDGPVAPASGEEIRKTVTPPASATVPSIISADLVIVGDLQSDGELQIDGTVEGNITSRSVTIGQGAVVRGNLVADSTRIYGTLVGDIKAGSVTLAKTAKVEADVHHLSLSVEAGAGLLGSLRRLETERKPNGTHGAAS